MLTASGIGWTEWRDNHFGKYRNAVGISTDYFFDSDAITNELALEYLNKGFITDEMKDRVTEKLSDMNRLGAQENNEIYYMRFDSVFGMKNSFYSFRLNNRYHFNSTFSRDVFELYFRGNKDFAGKQADLNDFVFQELFYQQFNFSFGHRYYRGENLFGYMAGLTFNKGQKHYLLEAEKALIYTDVYGEYIDLDVNGKLYMSDSSANRFGAFKGMGFSGDFSFYWQSKNKNMLTLTAENLGYIRWNSNSTYVPIDTVFHFEGIDVSYLFDLEDTIRKTISLDSSLVEPYLTHREKKSYIKPTPALLKVNYRYILQPEKMNLEGEAGYLMFATANPYGSVKFNYIIANDQFGLKLRYGGYDGFNVGLSWRIQFLDRWLFSAESDYLTSMLNSGSSGHGALITVAAYF
jgi:hypothetical protein